MRKKNLVMEPGAYQWALPNTVDVPADELVARLDFYSESIILYLLDKGIIINRVVSAHDVALAILSAVPLSSGLLPTDALWWRQGKVGAEVALWRPPQIWKVAHQAEPFKPARRFKLPMPGLIFVCLPGRAPGVYAAKRRPKLLTSPIYHAPLFDVYEDGTSCAGSNKYPEKVEEIPESFFTSFFTHGTASGSRSKKYQSDLMKLWEELDGKHKYPMDDLVEFGTIADILK